MWMIIGNWMKLVEMQQPAKMTVSFHLLNFFSICAQPNNFEYSPKVL